MRIFSYFVKRKQTITLLLHFGWYGKGDCKSMAGEEQEVRHYVERSEDIPRVYQVDFQTLMESYIYAPTFDDRSQTQIGQLLSLYREIFKGWPWYETYRHADILEKMLIELQPTLHTNPFMFIARQQEEIIGFAWGFEGSIWEIPLWTIRTQPSLTLEQVESVMGEVEHTRGLYGWGDKEMTYVADIAVAPKARGGAKVAAELMRQMAERQVEVGVPQYISWTVRKGEENGEGKSPRMYNMVEMLGGREVKDWGVMPSNPSLHSVVMAGDFRDALKVLGQGSAAVGRHFLTQTRMRNGYGGGRHV